MLLQVFIEFIKIEGLYWITPEYTQPALGKDEFSVNFYENGFSIKYFSKFKIMNVDIIFLSVIFQPIIYEGQDKNPEMCRVLLTHEIMCR